MPDVSGALTAGRRAAEARMLDTFAIRKPAGYGMVNGVETQTYTDLFTTKGRVKNSGTVVRDAQAGDRTVATVIRELHIPWGSPVIPTNAVAVCTAVDATSDPTLLGAVMRIDGSAPGSQMTARRLQISEVLS
jgi:hypothetical protein